MAESIEQRGTRELERRLIAAGRHVEPSPRKTFDLLVDGVLAEVKVRGYAMSRLDFIGLTDAQFAALESGTPFRLFVVTNAVAENPADFEVAEFAGLDLLALSPTVESTYYYYYGSKLRALPSTPLPPAAVDQSKDAEGRSSRSP